MKEFVNLLNSVVVVHTRGGNGKTLEFRPFYDKTVGMNSSFIDEIDEISYYKYTTTPPEPRENTIFIVEREMVAMNPERTDLVFPARTWTYPPEDTIHCMGFGRF